MEHDVDRAVEIARLQPLEEVLLVDEIRDVAIDQIAELVGAREIVHRDDVALAALVQRAHQVGTDESGSAGDDVDHAQSR